MQDDLDIGPPEPQRPGDPEIRRITFAASRVADHAARELALLVRATQVPDDRHARELELEADVAYRDLVALTEEHGLGH